MKSLIKDPRYYQIAMLGSLLTYGVLALEFAIAPANIAVIFAVSLLAQYVFCKAVKINLEYKSALITALSLCLLLRTNLLWVAAFAALLAIGSKFLIRANNKHIFNPTNFALIVCVLLTGSAWISPGQWGNEVLLAFFFGCMGLLVVCKAARSSVSIVFLSSYAAILFARALWLGDPLEIPLHQMQSGAFLLFTFFMISDPKTMPNSSFGRVMYALVAASAAGIFQFMFYNPLAVIYALPIANIFAVAIDRVKPDEKYIWRTS